VVHKGCLDLSPRFVCGAWYELLKVKRMGRCKKIALRHLFFIRYWNYNLVVMVKFNNNINALVRPHKVKYL
jgi:hypothetical protein